MNIYLGFKLKDENMNIYLGFKLKWTKFGQITLPFSVVSLDLRLSLKIAEHEV